MRASLWSRTLGAWRWWLAALAAGLVLAFVALPSWRNARQQERAALEMELELSKYEDWVLQIEEIREQVDARSRAADDRWAGLFPRERGEDLLFLEMARIADDCRLRDFRLSAVDEEKRRDRSEDEGSGVRDAMLSDFRVKAAFLADMEGTARFLAGLNSIPRAMRIVNIGICDTRNGLQVEMEMELYVDISTHS